MEKLYVSAFGLTFSGDENSTLVSDGLISFVAEPYATCMRALTTDLQVAGYKCPDSALDRVPIAATWELPDYNGLYLELEVPADALLSVDEEAYERLCIGDPDARNEIWCGHSQILLWEIQPEWIVGTHFVYNK